MILNEQITNNFYKLQPYTSLKEGPVFCLIFFLFCF